MKLRFHLFLIFVFSFSALFAQTLEQAKGMLEKGDYEAARPVFEKFVKSQPANGNYNLWYGICCLQTGQAEKAISPLETAVKRKVPSGQLYLGQAYIATYRFEEAVSTFDAYIKDLTRLKRSTEQADALLEQSKLGLRMLKGVEEVTVIDSIVVGKEAFLEAYHLSEESGTLYAFQAFFDTQETNEGVVYETEIGNKIYYGNRDEEGVMNIYSRLKLNNKWSAESEVKLPETINTGKDANYPYVLTDGVTIYYSAKGAHSLGGYDIFVTRFNSATESYFASENVGMPFNSPANDYMYVIDEFNNLGWFATDRNQPADTVCIYVFVPNSSKIAYNYETIEAGRLRNLARLHSIEETWKDEALVAEAQKRLQTAIEKDGDTQNTRDFEFIINDGLTYYALTDFRSAKAREQFQRYKQMGKDYNVLQDKLNRMRGEYQQASAANKSKLAPGMIDIELRLKTMYGQINDLAVDIRNTEINSLTK